MAVVNVIKLSGNLQVELYPLVMIKKDAHSQLPPREESATGAGWSIYSLKSVNVAAILQLERYIV